MDKADKVALLARRDNYTKIETDAGFFLVRPLSFAEARRLFWAPLERGEIAKASDGAPDMDALSGYLSDPERAFDIISTATVNDDGSPFFESSERAAFLALTQDRIAWAFDLVSAIVELSLAPPADATAENF